MNEFRIIQTQPLTKAYVLPYEVQEYRRVWYLPWPKWCPLKERSGCDAYGESKKRFQNLTEARLYIEQRLAARAVREQEQAQRQEEQRQQVQLPRVIEVFDTPMAG